MRHPCRRQRRQQAGCYAFRVAVHDWAFEVQVYAVPLAYVSVSRNVPAALAAPEGATPWKLPRKV